MKMHRGAEVHIHAFLTTERNGNEWSGPRIGRCTPTRGKSSLQSLLLNLKYIISWVCAHTRKRSTERYSKDRYP
jgi:hypothetical protein